MYTYRNEYNISFFRLVTRRHVSKSFGLLTVSSCHEVSESTAKYPSVFTVFDRRTSVSTAFCFRPKTRYDRRKRATAKERRRRRHYNVRVYASLRFESKKKTIVASFNFLRRFLNTVHAFIGLHTQLRGRLAQRTCCHVQRRRSR